MLHRIRELLGSRSRDPEPASTEDASTASARESGESVYYDIAVQRLDAQAEQIASLDAKAANVFLIASTVLPISASLLTDGDSSFANCLGAKIALAIGLAAYVWVACFFIRAYRVARWYFRPSLQSLKQFKEGKDSDRVRRWVGNQCTRSYYDNKPGISTKARYVDFATWGLAAEVAALTAAVLIPAFF